MNLFSPDLQNVYVTRNYVINSNVGVRDVGSNVFSAKYARASKMGWFTSEGAHAIRRRSNVSNLSHESTARGVDCSWIGNY